jgi:hypothetical protein
MRIGTSLLAMHAGVPFMSAQVWPAPQSLSELQAKFVPVSSGEEQANKPKQAAIPATLATEVPDISRAMIRSSLAR